MTAIISKKSIALIAVATIVSFGIGTTFGPAVTAATLPVPPNPEHVAFQRAVDKLEQEVNEVTDKVNRLNDKISTDKVPEVISKDISTLEDKINVLGVRLHKLDSLIEDMDEVKKEIKSMKAPLLSQLLSADLNKSEYRAGDSLTVSGVGLPNRPLRITLLDSDRLIISEGSTVTDSAGKFSFTIRLSRNLSDGTYMLQVGQDSSSIERTLRIVSVPIQRVEGLSLTTNRAEYLRGDRVLLSGETTPATWVDLDIFDRNGVQMVRTATKSDAFGRYSLEYTIPSNAVLGEHEARAHVGSKLITVKFSVVSSRSSPLTTEQISITTDKFTYARGDLVRITGTGKPNEKVTIIVEPPFGDNLVLTTRTDAFGKYSTLFTVKQDAFAGSWTITAKQGTEFAATTARVV